MPSHKLEKKINNHKALNILPMTSFQINSSIVKMKIGSRLEDFLPWVNWERPEKKKEEKKSKEKLYFFLSWRTRRIKYFHLAIQTVILYASQRTGKEGEKEKDEQEENFEAAEEKMFEIKFSTQKEISWNVVIIYNEIKFLQWKYKLEN